MIPALILLTHTKQNMKYLTMLGRLLCLAERLEVTDFEAVSPLLQECNITLDQLLTAQLEAFNWRVKVMSG